MSHKGSTCKTRGKKELYASVVAAEDMQQSKILIYELRAELLVQ